MGRNCVTSRPQWNHSHVSMFLSSFGNLPLINTVPAKQSGFSAVCLFHVALNIWKTSHAIQFEQQLDLRPGPLLTQGGLTLVSPWSHPGLMVPLALPVTNEPVSKLMKTWSRIICYICIKKIPENHPQKSEHTKPVNVVWKFPAAV